MADATFTLNQQVGGEYVCNVLVFSNVIPDMEVLQAAADSIRAAWNTYVVDRLWNQWSMDSVTVSFNASAPVYSTVVPFTSGTLVGGVNAEGQANQLSLLVTTSVLDTPPNRGRVYFAGLTEQDFANGLWGQGCVDDFEALVQHLANGIDANGSDIYLRIARRNEEGIITLSNAVQGVLGHRNPATQRRRRRGG